jgi:hypothetical protein
VNFLPPRLPGKCEASTATPVVPAPRAGHAMASTVRHAISLCLSSPRLNVRQCRALRSLRNAAAPERVWSPQGNVSIMCGGYTHVTSTDKIYARSSDAKVQPDPPNLAFHP